MTTRTAGTAVAEGVPEADGQEAVMVGMAAGECIAEG